ncbi:MAG: magnesium transporter CorA family protein [Eubacteriales bacterium]|nr:magnesium transporter CorA family protein [Eubacteriales bacterium]MDD4327553.1 magnesium transporter CorA family protein [Eubacteriales bacterium]MDD4716692.1 magnesium transporter CorA family protein [Eubacteriales bacterium]NCU25447.1 magnesium transporter CorA family protein [Candidatus Nomurabacteria bacterium]
MLEIFRTITHDISGKVHTELEQLTEITENCWIDLTAPTEDELEVVETALGVPSEFLRYPLDEEERPRIDVEEDEGQILIITDLPYVRRDGVYAKYETQPLGILLTGKHIVTISLRESTTLDQFKANRVKNFKTEFRTRFTFQIMFAGAKDYLKFLRYMDKTIEAAERQLTKSISNKELFKLMELGKSLIYFSTSLKSNEGVLEKMMRNKYIKLYEDDQELLDDVSIEYRQAYDMANIYASVINSTMDAYASIISNNLNVVMKFMAAMTIVLSVPTVIYSFFGQNFPMPWDNTESFAQMPWPFIAIVAGSGIISGLVLWWLKKRDMM